MEYNQVHQWELAVDAAEKNPLADLPENPNPGDKWEGDGSDGVRRRWIAVRVVAGNYGGRWAYWMPWKNETNQNGVGENPEFKAVSDKIFNGDGHNFIGLLDNPFIRAGIQWVLVDPKPAAPIIRYEVEPPLPARHERYERSREVYDVETGLSRDISDPEPEKGKIEVPTTG